MEWQVLSSRAQFGAGGEQHFVPDRCVLHRSDTSAPLGIVSDQYHPVQPHEVIEFFGDLVYSAGLQLDTAGTLFGGKRFWALAKIGEDCLVDNHDVIKGYLLLTSSADGLRATEARFTSVRVVCSNTLSMSDVRDAATQLRITHRVQFQPDYVKRKLGLAPQTFEQFMAKMRKLADYSMSDARAELELTEFLQKEHGQPAGRTFRKAMELFRGLARGFDEPGFAGTAWGLLGAFTETLDHGTRARSESHRFANAVMGTGVQDKSLFRDRLLALVQ
jgi:phage/plasmid-like protein (TIGR03299 family)